jgi:ribosomal protein L11 methyltransferase
VTNGEVGNPVAGDPAPSMDWLEVALTVNGELAEAVAEVLARFAPNGVMTEQGVRHLNEEDEGSADGPIVVRAYLPMDERLEMTRRQLEESLHYLGLIQALPAPVWTHVADQNWMEAWKRHYKPIPIGRRLLIVPAWMDVAEADRVVVRIDPGMAFGTGTHPSTQLCLELIDEFLAVRPGSAAPTMIDIGCGSGILSIAAIKLGAASALGVDIDAQSIRNARENAETNGVDRELTLAMGSMENILRGEFALRSSRLVAANILAPVIIRLLGAGLDKLVEPGGVLIVGGILEQQAKRVRVAAESARLSVDQTRQMGDWVAFSLAK